MLLYSSESAVNPSLFLIMDQRIPDSYVTFPDLVGSPMQLGIRQPSPVYPQGHDIVFHFYLNYNGKPIDLADWTLTGYVKKNVYAQNVLFKSASQNGIYPAGSPGYYYFLMPGNISGLFLPGLYYMEVVGVQKIGEGEFIKDITVSLMNTNFQIVLAPSSPNPKLASKVTSEVLYDPSTGQLIITQQSVEPTYPPVVDTTKP